MAAASARACASTGGAAAFGTPETLESVPANTRAPSQPARTRPAHARTAGAQLTDAQARSHAPVGAEGAAPAARGAAAHGMPSGAEAASAGPTPSSSPSSPVAASTPISIPVRLEALARGRRKRAAVAAVRQAPESVGRLARAAAAATATSSSHGGGPSPQERVQLFGARRGGVGPKPRRVRRAEAARVSHEASGGEPPETVADAERVIAACARSPRGGRERRAACRNSEPATAAAAAPNSCSGGRPGASRGTLASQDLGPRCLGEAVVVPVGPGEPLGGILASLISAGNGSKIIF